MVCPSLGIVIPKNHNTSFHMTSSSSRKLSRKQQSLMLSYAEEETDVPGTVNGVTMPTGQTTAHPRICFVFVVCLVYVSFIIFFLIKKKIIITMTQTHNRDPATKTHKTTHMTPLCKQTRSWF